MSRRFHGPVYFKMHFTALFTAKMEAPFHSLAHYNMRSDKGNPTVVKRSKMPFLGVLLLTTGLWDLKDILNLRQNRSKINWSV